MGFVSNINPTFISGANQFNVLRSADFPLITVVGMTFILDYRRPGSFLRFGFGTWRKLYLRKKEILGLGGLVGSGRSELLGAIFSVIPHPAGRIIKNGKPVQIREPIY
jgi:hypothetical protein